MSGDLGLKMIGKDPAGLGKGISVDEEGIVNVKNKVDNVLIAEGNLTELEPLEIPATKSKALMIALKGLGGSEDNTIKFEHNVDGLGYLPWKDGQGNPIELLVKGDEEGVFGGFQGFPYFSGGRLRVDGLLGAEINVSEGLDSENYQLKVIHDVERVFNGESLGVYKDEPINVFYTVQLDEAKVVGNIKLTGSSLNEGVQNFKFEGSNDNESWVTLLTDILPNSNTENHFTFVNDTAYVYYRVHAIDNYGSSRRLRISNIKLHLEDTSTQVQSGQIYYIEPAIGFEVAAWNVFNGLNRTTYGTKDVFAIVDLGQSKKVDKILIGTNESSTVVKNFVLRGSTDNEVWETLLEEETVNSGEVNTFELTTIGSYRYYHIEALSNHGSSAGVYFGNVELIVSGILYQVKIQEVL